MDFLQRFLNWIMPGHTVIEVNTTPPPILPIEHLKEIDNSHINQVLCDSYRIRIESFMQRTPLLCIDGSINQSWYGELAMGLPDLSLAEIDLLLKDLREAEYDALEKALSSKGAILDDDKPDLFEQIISRLAPEIEHDLESRTYRVKQYGGWYLVMSEL